jgi:hypothetical protein
VVCGDPGHQGQTGSGRPGAKGSDHFKFAIFGLLEPAAVDKVNNVLTGIGEDIDDRSSVKHCAGACT